MLIKEQNVIDQNLEGAGEVSDYLPTSRLISRSPYEGNNIACFYAAEHPTLAPDPTARLRWGVAVEIKPIIGDGGPWVEWFRLGVNQQVRMMPVNESCYVRFHLDIFETVTLLRAVYGPFIKVYAGW